MTIFEVEKYFLEDVNAMFKDGSEVDSDKAYFHQMNHIVPFLKLTTVQANRTNCGSVTSNNKAMNEAVKEGTSEYGPGT
jgi:hypothetical protein